MIHSLIKKIDGGGGCGGAFADVTTCRIKNANMTSCMQTGFMLIMCFGGGGLKKASRDCGDAAAA